MSHYDTLGVSKSASPEEIKKAYRKLASQHHPDKGGDTAKFQQIEEAYRILSDPTQRQQYDNPQPQGFHFNFNGSDIDGMDVHDIFRNFGFGGGSPFGGFQQRQPRKNKDLRIEVAVSLAETLQDQKKTLSVQTTNGHRETIEVTIPRGVTHGTSIRYPGLGDTFFSSLPRGDLYVVVKLIPHELYVVHDTNIVAALSIDCFEAMLGTDAEVTGLDGKIFMLTVPPGTQNGTMLRIKGEGLYNMNNHARGNLLVKIDITVPKYLTETQKELIKKAQTEK